MINNTDYGVGALQINTGINNTAFGAYSAYNNLDASNNTAVGSNSAYFNTSGSNNTSVGAGSLCNNTFGEKNTAVGSSALEGPTGKSCGNENVAIGAQALYENDGDLNTAIGTYAALGVTGSYNTFLGANTSFDNTANSYNYSTAIGYEAKITSSNKIMLGGSNGGVYPQVVAPGGITGPTGSFTYLSSSNNTYLATSSGNVGIGTKNPAYNLDVSGNVNISGSLSGTYPVPGIIKDLTTSGLNFISIDMSGTIIAAVNNENYNFPFINSGSTYGNGGNIWLSIDSSNGFTVQNTPKLYYTCVALKISGNTVYITACATGYDENTLNVYSTSFSYSSPTSTPTWTGVNVNYGGYVTSLTGISMSNNGQYRVANSGDNQNYCIFYSSDYGATWQQSNTKDTNPDNQYSSGIVISGNPYSGSNYYAYSAWQNNVIYFGLPQQPFILSNDTGQSYGPIGFGSNMGANSIACSFNGQYVTAVGPSAWNNNGYQFYVSINSGVSWINTSPFVSTSRFVGIDMSPSGLYQIAVDYYGIVAISSNYGGTWTQFPYLTFPVGLTSVALNPNIDNTGVWSFWISSTNGILTYDLYTNLALKINSIVVAPAYYVYSDYRIKENIEELKNLSLTTDNLRPVKYLNKLNKQHEYGLIAHEVQDVLPELVTGIKDSEDYQKVNYTGLIPILIKELKELKERVKIIENKTN